jgi:predicted N-formylglutamate amidohydrolase
MGVALLRADEPAPAIVLNESGRSRVFLTADHAGRRVPASLGDLGVSAADMERHIAWDIGIEAVTRRLAVALDAVAVLQAYSRLVIDCNRQPAVPSAFPEVSEATPVPGNVGLSAAQKLARREAIFDPYHQVIARLLAARAARRPIYVAMHSFTPVYLGQAREIEVAVLYNRNPRGGLALADILREEAGLVVAENAPYRVSDETDYGVPVHAERGGLDYIELEIRQDLIAHEAGQVAWAERLAVALPKVIERLEEIGG